MKGKREWRERERKREFERRYLKNYLYLQRYAFKLEVIFVCVCTRGDLCGIGEFLRKKPKVIRHQTSCSPKMKTIQTDLKTTAN